MEIQQDMVQRGEKDSECLRRRLFNVNMRLFKDNNNYRRIVISVCDYMLKILDYDYSNYSTLKGVSGANLAIPFNIIAISKDGSNKILINPVITSMSKETVEVQSNCGSLLLKANHPVRRRNWVEVSYFDTQGQNRKEKYTLSNGGGTIQHEIEHNLGVLITDEKGHI
jgi:peptide deformylase